MNRIKLCVNVDHIATLREARGEFYPDPVEGAILCEESGAHGITVHLREDRRHIQDADIFALKKVVKGKFNLEMALSDEIIEIALKTVPDQITLVPEKREELTTEGGLDVRGKIKKIREVIQDFHNPGILVSLFIEPEIEAIELAKDAGADYIELHTGSYCIAANNLYAREKSKVAEKRESEKLGYELQRLKNAADRANELGVGVNAGHGLNHFNLAPVLNLSGLDELNIGHSIISRSIFLGIPGAVEELLSIIHPGGRK